MPKVYDIYTDMDEATLTEVGFEIMKKWIAFAMGKEEIAGHFVRNPTGKMASSIRMEGRGVAHIAIIADAPEAEILETGHDAVDLKIKLTPGRAYPMHRGEAGSYGSNGYSAPILNSTFSGKARNVWAVVRAAGSTGFATVPSEINSENADSWIIPAMSAWSPAQHLADMIRNGSVLNG